MGLARLGIRLQAGASTCDITRDGTCGYGISEYSIHVDGISMSRKAYVLVDLKFGGLIGPTKWVQGAKPPACMKRSSFDAYIILCQHSVSSSSSNVDSHSDRLRLGHVYTMTNSACILSGS